MTHYTILGRSNNTISLIADAASELSPSKVTFTIIENMEVPREPPYLLERKSKVAFHHIKKEQYEGTFPNLLLGAIRVETKRIILDDFREVFDVNPKDFAILIHPSSIISTETDIRPGCFVGPGCILSPYVSLDCLTTMNRGVTIGHHTKVGYCCTINPGVNIAGGTTIGNFTTIGMGANIVNDVQIGRNVTIGAGSLVTKSVPNNTVAYGVPAKEIRTNR